MDNIRTVIGDITKEDVDAVVNAANTSLLGGGGVDGAIHRAAGPDLLKECKTLNGCRTGEAKITKGYGLKARYVIHTVGPVWSGGNNNEDKLLADCYRNSLKIASLYDIRSIAFPAISTGVYRFPLERAANIAIDTIRLFLKDNTCIRDIILVCFNRETYKIYNDILKNK